MSGFIVTQLCDLSASHMLAVWHKEVPEVWLAAIIITGIMQAGDAVGSGGKCLDGVCVTYMFTWLCVICASTFVMCACIYLCTVTVVRSEWYFFQIWSFLGLLPWVPVIHDGTHAHKCICASTHNSFFQLWWKWLMAPRVTQYKCCLKCFFINSDEMFTSWYA